MGFFSSQLLKNIEWKDESRNQIVYRFPMNGQKIMCGSNLTVRDSQVAIFVSNGKICDIFESGLHKLNTSSLPFLSKLLAWPTGFKSPFTAEVYFVNTKQFPNQKWGTTNPITIRDNEFGPIRVRGYGTFSFRVEDPERLLKELFGTNSSLTTADIIEYLKSILVSGVSDTMAESKVSALDLAANLMEFSQACKRQVGDKFRELGLELVNLVCENFSFPEEVEKAIDTRSSMGFIDDKMDTYVKYQTVNAMKDSAKNPTNSMASTAMNMTSGLVMGNMFANTLGQAMNSNNYNNQQNAYNQQPKKICPNCNSANVDGAKFCFNCGYSFMPMTCPDCNNPVQSGAKFCPNCGHRF